MQDHRDRAARATAAPLSFDRMYERAEPAFGFAPSPELAAALAHRRRGGVALDLGAGAGRDRLALARHGLDVVAIDASRGGVERIEQTARDEGLAGRIDARCADVCDLCWADRRYDVVAAVTLLDHLSREAFEPVWRAMIDALADDGLLFVEVHTTEDPGAEGGASPLRGPVSESAWHVARYFRPNELLRLAAADLRVIRYEERLEWDRSHGVPHGHAKATLLASGMDQSIRYFGCPPRHAPPTDIPGAESSDQGITSTPPRS